MQFDRDLSTVTPQSAPEPLKTGWYPADISSQQEKPNNKGTGNYLEFKYKLRNGRNMTSRHNVKHSNPQTVDIAYQELSAIAHAVGHPRARAAQELVGGPLELYIVEEPRTDKPGVMGNEVKGFRAIGAGGPVGHTGAVGTQVTAAPAWAAPAPVAQAYVPPQPVAPAQPTWAPPPAASAPVAQPQYAPPPQTQPAPVTPAGASAVPPWAR